MSRSSESHTEPYNPRGARIGSLIFLTIWCTVTFVGVYFATRDAILSHLNGGSITGKELFSAMFMTPFLATALAMIVPMLRPTPANPPHYRIDRFQNREIIRLSPGLLASFVMSLAACCFLGIFACVIPRHEESLSYVITVWAIVIAATIALTLYAQYLNSTGRYDLVLDHNTKTLSIPRKWKQKTRVEIPFRDIADIRLETRIDHSNSEPSRSLDLLLYRKNGDIVPIQEALWMFSKHTLDHWLLDRIRNSR